MRTKLLKSKYLLSALLMAMLITCLALAGVSAIGARAAAVTFGDTYGDAPATYGGNVTDGITITYTNSFWMADVGATGYARIPVKNYSAGYISFELTTQKDAIVRLFAFGGNWGGGNTANVFEETVKAGATKYVSFDAADLIDNHTTWGTVDKADFDLGFQCYETNGENTITINSLRVTEQEVLPPEPPVTDVTIGDWTATDSAHMSVTNGTVTAEDGTSYTGLKLSWNKDVAQYSNVNAQVTNFDASKTPKLCISFYVDKDVKLGVWNGDSDTISSHTQYTAGYHKLVFDVSERESISRLQLYFDSGEVPDFEDTKTAVIDYIGFFDDAQTVNIALDKYENSGNVFTVDTTDDKLSLEWDAQSAVTLYPSVIIPVENWQPFSRYLVLDMSFTDSASFRFFFNNGKFDAWNNPLEASSLTNGYVAYDKGRQLICLDTQAAYVADMIAPDSDNKLYIYMYGGNTALDDSLIKNVTFNEMYFSETAVEPVTLKVNVDYAAGTVTFDDKLEVSAAADFSALLSSGDTVTPGKLYIRVAAKPEMQTEITLVKAVLTEDNAPEALTEEDSISYPTAEGYEFKFGDDGEWGATKSWNGLEAGKDYKIYIRKLASDTAFASDEICVTVYLDGEYTPATVDLANPSSRDDVITTENVDGKVVLRYNEATAASGYYYVSFPVQNWRSGNRYVVLDLSFAEAAKVKFYLSDNSKVGQWGPDTTSILADDKTYQKGRYILCLDTYAAYKAGMITQDGANTFFIYCDSYFAPSVSREKEITINSIEFSKDSVDPVSLNVNVDYAAGTVTFDDTKLEVSADENFATLITDGGNVAPGKLYIRVAANHDVAYELTLVKGVITQATAPKAQGSETSISFAHADGYDVKLDDEQDWSATKVWENLELGSEHVVHIRKSATDSAFASDEITFTVTVGVYADTSVALDRYAYLVSGNISSDEVLTAKYEGGKLIVDWDAKDAAYKWLGIAVPVENWIMGNRYLIIDMSLTEIAELRIFLYNGELAENGPNESSSLTGNYRAFGKGRYVLCLDTQDVYSAGMISAGDNNTLYIYLRGDMKEVTSLAKSITFNEIHFGKTEVDTAELTVAVDYKKGTVDFDDEKVEVFSDSAYTKAVQKGGNVGPGKLYIRSKSNAEMTAEVTLAKAELSESSAPQAIVGTDSISFSDGGYEYKFGDDGEWGTTASWSNLNPDTEYVIYIRIPGGENAFASDEISVTKKTKSLPGTNQQEKPGTTEAPDRGCGCKSSVAGVSLPVAALLLAGCALVLRRRRSVK